MAEYHVGAGVLGIYAGTLNKKGNMWTNQTECTDEAICAVRDYMKLEADVKKQNSSGYEWKLKDGRTISLILTIDGGTTDEQD